MDFKASFEKEGYLVVENLLSPAEVADCQAEILCLHQFAAGQEAAAEKADSGHRAPARATRTLCQRRNARRPVAGVAEGGKHARVFRSVSEIGTASETHRCRSGLNRRGFAAV